MHRSYSEYLVSNPVHSALQKFRRQKLTNWFATFWHRRILIFKTFRNLFTNNSMSTPYGWTYRWKTVISFGCHTRFLTYSEKVYYNYWALQSQRHYMANILHNYDFRQKKITVKSAYVSVKLKWGQIAATTKLYIKIHNFLTIA